ncbi:MAG: tryptophan synthase subunit beta [Deltaproteobacteria bacterium]|nr:tryptophan synthase subunit beta [Deltaproteobacteria bacterium]
MTASTDLLATVAPPQPPKRPLLPDARGYFGAFGGAYVPEILRPNLQELEQVFASVRHDPVFWAEYWRELATFSGRPTPVTPLPHLSRYLGGAQIFLKREDLGQTGAHKVNNVIGQGLITRRLGKKRVIAETGAGQHGIATATMAARFGLEAVIYMGAEDVERQRPNVFWMEQMGAKVVAVEAGARTLKDAINEALRDWSTNFATTHYLLGTACGPHPFPAIVAWLQSVAGTEARAQMLQLTGRLPSRVYACVGGGSNALGIFQGFLDEPEVTLVGAEAGGRGSGSGEHAARIAGGQGRRGIAQGYETLFLQTRDGQMLDTHSVAAGLDYVGVSPLIAALSEAKRLTMAVALDQEVVEAVRLLMRYEGIIPALESAHGLAVAIREAPRLKSSDSLLVNLSGRGDKDIFTIASALGDASWAKFLKHKADSMMEQDHA